MWHVDNGKEDGGLSGKACGVNKKNEFSGQQPESHQLLGNSVIAASRMQ